MAQRIDSHWTVRNRLEHAISEEVLPFWSALSGPRQEGPANAGAFLTLIGLAVLFYSCFMYARRTFKLDSHAPSGYEDKFGPTVLGLALFAGLIVFLCLE